MKKKFRNNGKDTTKLLPQYFSIVYTDAQYEVTYYCYNVNDVMDVNLLHFELSEVFDTINRCKFKFFHGPHGIPSALLKIRLITLWKPLHNLYNLSLKSNTFPLSTGKVRSLPYFHRIGYTQTIRFYCSA